MMEKLIILLASTCTLFLSACTWGNKQANKWYLHVPCDMPGAVQVPASLYFSRDSVNMYAERAYKTDDPKGCFVVAACYYLNEQGALPDYIYTVPRAEADEFLMISAAQDYQPAIDLIHCLHDQDNWPYEF